MTRIKIKSGSLSGAKRALPRHRDMFIVYDRNVVLHEAKAFGKSPAMAIDADEEHKTMDTVMAICRWLMSMGAGRDSLLVAMGGGVTTDLAGFAACIYKRGIRYVNIPTTLLSMVDAGIGGKTGVNVDSYKNMVGIIRQPELTYICPETLSSLPARELRSGAAELLKTFIIKDDGNYQKAVEALTGTPDLTALAPLVKAAAEVKAAIVRRDEFETGKRRLLNLGHTYAHAIEWWEHSHGVADPCTHGEAVAIGIVKAAEESEKKGICPAGLAAKFRADFALCGLPTEIPCPEEELLPAIRQDKKAEEGKLNFVFIRRVGDVVIKRI